MSDAPGAPGLSPTWSSSNKDMVSCALGSSRLWFTIGGGIHPLQAGRRADLTYRSGSSWVGRDFRVQVIPRTRRLG